MKKHLQWKRWTLALVWTVMVCSAQAQDFWQSTGGPYGMALWSSLVTQDGTYYGGASTGSVYRKLSGSDKWTIVYNMQNDVLAMYEYQGNVYVGGASLIYSTDQGNTWAQVPGFPIDEQVRYIAENSLGELL